MLKELGVIIVRAILVLFFLIVSCDDPINNTTNVSSIAAETKGDLYVYAKDAVSGELISDVEYSSPAVGDSSITTYGDKGVCFPNLPVGENYAVYVSAKGYAPVVCNASIRFSENVSSPNVDAGVMKMFRKHMIMNECIMKT